MDLSDIYHEAEVLDVAGITPGERIIEVEENDFVGFIELVSSIQRFQPGTATPSKESTKQITIYPLPGWSFIIRRKP